MNRSDDTPRAGYRRKPQQDRSVQRVETILHAAESLIGMHGMAGLKMTEIAREAHVPVGSLYQYFPDRGAIVAALFERMAEGVHTQLEGAFEGVSTIEEASDRIEGIIDWYYSEYREHPTLRQILSSTESDPELMRLNVADSKRVGDTIHAAIGHLLPSNTGIDMEARTFLFCHLVGNLVLMSLITEPVMAERLLREWKLIIRASLFAESS